MIISAIFLWLTIKLNDTIWQQIESLPIRSSDLMLILLLLYTYQNLHREQWHSGNRIAWNIYFPSTLASSILDESEY